MKGSIGVMVMKMKNNLFNSPFEMSLRILIMLDEYGDKCAEDRIMAYDFMACYSTEFEIKDVNLHGNNALKFAELVSRRQLVSEAIKELVIKGLLIVEVGELFSYSISDLGQKCVHKMESPYALEYRNIIKSINKLYSEKSDTELLNMIQRKSVYQEV